MNNEDQVKQLEQRIVAAESRLIESNLSDAAKSANAFNHTQVVDLLRSKAKMVDNNVVVEVDTKHDETGEQVTIQLTPAEAIAFMRKDNANLFRENVAPAIVATTESKIDVRKLTPQQYRELRASNPAALGLR